MMQRLSFPRAGRLARISVPRLSLLAALAILLIGAALRLPEIGRPFVSSDHAEVAAVVSFFYPRDIRALAPSDPGSVWNLLQNPHGVAPVGLALAWISAVGGLGVTINEFWWNLPFALLGLCIIPLGYRLGVQLGGRRAGMLAALLLAVLPVHASTSRGSAGASQIAIALLAQVWAVTEAQRYFREPTARHQRWASLAIVCAVITDVLLPALFFVLLAVGVYSVGGEGLRARLREGRRLLFGSRLIVWPLVALAWPVGLLLLQAAGVISYGGLLARLFSGSEGQPGIWVGEFVRNVMLNLGPLALLLVLACAAASVRAALRLERHGFLLVWAGLYLAPFVLFSRPYVFDYLVCGVAPLVVNAAVVLARGLGGRRRGARVAAGVGAAALFALLLLRSVTMIFGADLGPLVGTRQAAGAVFPDQGLKAAAWWVRANSPSGALVFADAAFEPYQLSYYLRRPFLGVTDAAAPEDAFRLLDGSARAPDLYLVLPEHEGLLRAHVGDGPQLAATVTDGGRPLLLVFRAADGPAAVVERDDGNRAFDRQYGSWQAMFGR